MKVFQTRIWGADWGFTLKRGKYGCVVFGYLTVLWILSLDASLLIFSEIFWTSWHHPKSLDLSGFCLFCLGQLLWTNRDVAPIAYLESEPIRIALSPRISLTVAAALYGRSRRTNCGSEPPAALHMKIHEDTWRQQKTAQSITCSACCRQQSARLDLSVLDWRCTLQCCFHISYRFMIFLRTLVYICRDWVRRPHLSL